MKYLLAILLSLSTTLAGPWSGHVCTVAGHPGAAGTISSVSGSFVVPSIPSVEAKDVSFWVGIGGYGSRDIQQIGVDVYFTEGSYYCNLWWDMYPKKMVWETTFDHFPGDVITLSVRYSGRDKQGDKFELKATNETSGDSFSTVQATRNVTRNSAEWIVEKGSGWALPSTFSTTWTGLRVNGQVPGAFDVDLVNQLGIVVTGLQTDSFSVSK